MQLESNLTHAYMEACRLAWEKLLECSPETVCQNSKAAYESEAETYVVPYFGRSCRVCCIDRSLSFPEDSVEATTTETVLILHYLIHAEPKPLTGRTVSFQEVPKGGSIYYSTFRKRAIDPLVKTFSEDLTGFRKAAAAIGGLPESLGDASTTLYAFPLVPVTYVLWQGDEEVPSAGTILFDASVPHFLPVEDIVLAGSFGAYRLMDANKKQTK